MTYCIGVLLNDGMIFASDSRTNAGVDNIAKFCKMTVFERCGDRVIVLLSSGNLSGTQAVISVLKQRGDAEGVVRNLWNAQTMFDVGGLVGDAMRDIERRDVPDLPGSGIKFTDSVHRYRVGEALQSRQDAWGNQADARRCTCVRSMRPHRRSFLSSLA